MNILRYLYRQAILILSILVILSGVALLLLDDRSIISTVSKPQFHFYFIVQNSVDPFWKEVIKGAEVAAKDYNVVIEFCAPRFNDRNEELKYIDIATLSRVDGIITHAVGTEDFTNAIDRAYYKGIPVITFENDANKSKRYAFAGTNSYEIGKRAAELLIKATNGRGNVAIITNSDSNQDIIENNLKMNGFFSTLKDYKDIKIVKTYTSKMGILSSEEITQKIIESDENINAIFTVSSADTLGAAQLIVDRNKVGEIILIGYGSSEEITRYIEKEIIYGTVASDPYKMGYDSVKTLYNIKRGNSVPTFIDTEIKVITKDGLDEFKSLEEMRKNILKREKSYEQGDF
ncbi:D-allose-binding periplasmic protein precursor [Caloramator mitchellensis]|uniref:D-allose-binding periplasmic protein n=1 Tax=Caloramator mitchellensis TaxID=908809 RepID=A0A0R3JS93_CALMK|nr:substrate-binding domain-containing protein [Caloramator mitchellensis]KRQ86368.1 D-allose-binding periplasmic protein precursor [Caloramator mitchellensis]